MLCFSFFGALGPSNERSLEIDQKSTIFDQGPAKRDSWARFIPNAPSQLVCELVHGCRKS